nr:aminopeptidase [Lachnospiraceae bacterium]
KVLDFAEGYKKFLSTCKTERECTSYFEDLAIERGFISIEEAIANGKKLKAGDRIYAVNMEKEIALFVIGKEDISEGMNILGAHIDSPRLDLKQNPLYEDSEMAYFETHYYGGIKKYQWVTLPLALHGRISKTDGSSIDFSIGEDDDDPVFCITDLLPHLAAEQYKRDANKIIEGEDLNVLVGSMPFYEEIKDDKEKDLVKKNILNIIINYLENFNKENEKAPYKFAEEDFMSCEVEVVPAGKARDMGFDRSLILGYGHDDRVCSYPTFEAVCKAKKPRRTVCGNLVDKEEIGSVGATGMGSRFFENTVAELINLSGNYSDILLRRALTNSYAISSDVSGAYDSIYSSAFEKKNSAFIGKGFTINKYTGARGKSNSNDASAEYMGKIRGIFESKGITYHTSELGKVDQGGGGTIAYIFGNYNMNVIDGGVPVLSMHAPYEVISKVDLYEAYKAYVAFAMDA